MQKFTVLKRSNGEVLIIDNLKVRLSNLRRRVFAWAKVIDDFVRLPGVSMTMYGLTYDTKGTLVKPSSWEAGDIREFMIRLKARLGKRLLAYAWVAEVQQRGVVHYHVIAVHRGRAPMPDRSYKGKNTRGEVRNYKRMWEKGNSHSDFQVRSPYYLVSYVKKEYQKNFELFPSGAHAWAVWVSDDGLKMSLRLESLTAYKKTIFAEIRFDNEGIGFSECWEAMEWEVKRAKLADRLLGNGWEYIGQVQGAADLAAWGVTDELLKKNAYTRIACQPAYKGLNS